MTEKPKALRVRDYFHGVSLPHLYLGTMQLCFGQVMRDFSPFSVLVDLSDVPPKRMVLENAEAEDLSLPRDGSRCS